MAGKKKGSSGDGGAEFSFWDYMQEHDIPTLEKMEKQQESYKTYSTGSLMLDIAIGERDCDTGRPGIPERAIVEIFGINQSGKTTVAENLLKNVLEDNPKNLAVCIWAEEPDMDRLLGYGIDKKRVASLFTYQDGEVQGQLVERHFEAAKMAVQDPNVKLVILDSIKAVCSIKQLYKDGKPIDMESAEGLAIRANVITRFILNFKQYNKRAILFMTNQISDKIQTPGSGYVQNPRFNIHTPGGRAKEYEATLRINSTSSPILSKQKHGLTEEELLLGWEFTYRLIKNKYSKRTAYRTAHAQFYFDPAGFRKEMEILKCAEYLGIVSKGGGGHFSINGERLPARGAENVSKYLRQNKDIVLNLEKQVIERMDEVYAIGPGSDEDVDDDLLGAG